jgi:hypothetical protein
MLPGKYHGRVTILPSLIWHDFEDRQDCISKCYNLRSCHHGYNNECVQRLSTVEHKATFYSERSPPSRYHTKAETEWSLWSIILHFPFSAVLTVEKRFILCADFVRKSNRVLAFCLLNPSDRADGCVFPALFLTSTPGVICNFEPTILAHKNSIRSCTQHLRVHVFISRALESSIVTRFLRRQLVILLSLKSFPRSSMFPGKIEMSFLHKRLF